MCVTPIFKTVSVALDSMLCCSNNYEVGVATHISCWPMLVVSM